MRILSLNYVGYNHRSSQTNKTKSIPTTNDIKSLATPNICVSDSVSFGKKPQIYVTDVRELKDLTCGCCGRKMLALHESDDFLNKKIYYPAVISLKRIKKELNFNPSKCTPQLRKAYIYMREYAEKNPTFTATQILEMKEVMDYRSKLNDDENAAFDTIKAITKRIAHNSKYMIDELSKINPDFHKFEKKVFKELKKLSQDDPDKTFNEILNKPEIHKHHLENLQVKQLKILAQVERTIPFLDKTSYEKIENNLEFAKKVFQEENPAFHHKRSRIINAFNETLKDIANEELKEQVMKILNTLPDSNNDLDAFMVKTAQKDANAIMEILIGRIKNTNEHVKPRNRELKTGEKKDDKLNKKINYICLCGKCNNERQRTEYSVFFESHPKMKENIQKQMDQIIHYINTGILSGYDGYLSVIAKNIANESKTETTEGLKININKLDLAEGAKNRKLRMIEYKKRKKVDEKTPKIFKFGKGVMEKKQIKT